MSAFEEMPVLVLLAFAMIMRRRHAVHAKRRIITREHLQRYSIDLNALYEIVERELSDPEGHHWFASRIMQWLEPERTYVNYLLDSGTVMIGVLPVGD